MSDTRQHVHELIDRLTPDELASLEKQLESKLDPISRALANAPIDDEPETEEEHQAVEEAKEWLRHNKAVPHEEVLAEFGLTMEDFERMGRTPRPRVKEN
jgi:hypothetical protein